MIFYDPSQEKRTFFMRIALFTYERLVGCVGTIYIVKAQLIAPLCERIWLV